MRDYKAWLLEGRLTEDGQTYIEAVPGTGHGLGWTTDPDDALHFSREEDAEGLAQAIPMPGEVMRIAEHSWPGVPGL